MKKDIKKNGFAMVEILIAAVTVIGVFSLLYNSVYPLIGAYSASERYEDLDSKYVAFYIKEMLETDGNFANKFSIVNNVSFNACPYNGSNTCHIFKTYPYITTATGEEIPVDDIYSLNNEHYLYKNELCNQLRENSNQKNNQFFCNKYITGARVNRIIVTDYKFTNFKNAIKNSKNESITRSLKNYVSYIPSHEQAINKPGYRRIIVEIEHDSYNTVGDYYYTYASIEVKG